MTGPDCHATLVEVTEVLVDTLCPGSDNFNVEVYVAEGWEAKKLHRNLQKADWSATLESVSAGYSRFDRRCLDRLTECGSWLTMRPLLVHWTTQGSEEFRDNLRLCYGIKPANMPPCCDGCGERFNVAHAMLCKK